ncbi:MAG: fatty acid cis/trans isomerase [Candidatus Riflebacteria bacterium]|nr:fatty acid cis/trans isomerase [Candidatus Riflebacteria bacterium]
MKVRTTAWLAPLLLNVLLACSAQHLLAGSPSDKEYSYGREIKPILERHCIVCHACYDAPCQLKMESVEGLTRGASKAVVYKARPKAQAPTRIHIDASSTEAWRQKGFFSVLDGGQNSLLYRMIELGRKNAPTANEPMPADVKMGLARENLCPTNEEFNEYSHRRMHEGMPFGMAPLRPETLYALQGWVAQGAPLDGLDDPPSEQSVAIMDRWEQFLNAPDNRSRLLARYLYEHLFIAHLHFEPTASSGFFEMVRSSTPPGSPIQIIPTRLPNDDPGGPVYYRLRPVSGSIVQKTHVTYPFGLDKLEHLRRLFAQVDWKVDELPSYSPDNAANPFVTFAAIPAKLRYQFLLDNAFYVVQCFIRGPVCLGNIATDVIQDHFHNMFQRPESDLFCQDPDYAAAATKYLNLRGHDGFRLGLRPQWLKSEQRYGKLRQARYQKAGSPSMDDLWTGGGTNPDALMTVFRNADSATVIRGLRGQLPKTIWVMDYPIFERTYYLLVVNFDVFGDAVHQVATRLYFDLLRAEAELNFLRFMPAESRQKMLESWYRGSLASLKTMAVYPELDEKTPTQVKAKGQDPKADFVQQLRTRMPSLAGRAGELTGNSFLENDRVLDASMLEPADKALQSLENGTAAEHPFIKWLPEVTFVRVGYGDRAKDLAYTLLRNRALRNVAFMFRETSRQEPEKDTVTVLRGPVTCYPNFIFQISPTKVDDFVQQLEAVTTQEGFTALVNQYGVRRTHPFFWGAFEFFKNYQAWVNPLERGIFDANRYSNF